MSTVYERLKTVQIKLPDVQPPVVDGYVAAFVPFVRTGNVIYVSGRVAKKDGKPWAGKLGENITIEEGKQAARDIAIELIATLQAAVGDLNKITRIVKLVVLVNSTPHFTEPHVVANGASELFLEVFGERGTHARTSHGGAAIPFGCCVEIEMVVETFGSESVCEVWGADGEFDQWYKGQTGDTVIDEARRVSRDGASRKTLKAIVDYAMLA